MFDELKKYKHNDHFFLTPKTELADVCNAPTNKSGVFLVYELKNHRIDLVYIGSSGKLQSNGRIKHRKGGLYDEIVNGHEPGEPPRKKYWKQRMIDEKIEALDIYWYNTFDPANREIPLHAQAILMQRVYDVLGRLPRWNKEL